MTDTAQHMPFLADAATMELEDLGPLEEATGEPMQAFGVSLWQGGEQEAGVWECTPGRLTGSSRPTSSCTSCPAG